MPAELEPVWVALAAEVAAVEEPEAMELEDSPEDMEPDMEEEGMLVVEPDAEPAEEEPEAAAVAVPV